MSEYPELPWIAAGETPWNEPLLDLRPITHTMISTSTDPQMAQNAISYTRSDGSEFAQQPPPASRVIATDLQLATDGPLLPGILFLPQVMEHKWALFFYAQQIIFVRSWQRQVVMTASTVQDGNTLRITQLTGAPFMDAPPEFTLAAAWFILGSHALGELVPAPLPPGTAEQDAGMVAMSLYGKQAALGTFNLQLWPALTGPLRSLSQLHIAVARNDLERVKALLAAGWNPNALAQDGLATLHWALSSSTPMLEALLDQGAQVDVRSVEGATPLMNAVQANNAAQVTLLLARGADVNARDLRGFTSLHRAAEMGHEDIVNLLLDQGADPTLGVGDITPLKLARQQEHVAIIRRLRIAEG